MHISLKPVFLSILSIILSGGVISAQVIQPTTVLNKDSLQKSSKRFVAKQYSLSKDSSKKQSRFDFDYVLLNSAFQYQHGGFGNQLLPQNYVRNSVRISYSLFGIPLQNTANIALENGKFSYGLNRFSLSFDKAKYQNQWKSYTDSISKVNDVAKRELHKEIIRAKSRQDSIAFVIKRKTDTDPKKYLEGELMDTLNNQGSTDSIQKIHSEINKLAKQYHALSEQIETFKNTLNNHSVTDSLKRLKKIKPSDIQKYSDIQPSQMQKVLSSVQTFEVGTFAPRYSILVLNGIMLKGLNAEMVLKKFYVAVAAGGYSLANPFNTSENLFQKKANDGIIKLIRAGIGSPDKNHLYVSVLHGTNKKPEETKVFSNGLEISSGTVFNVETRYNVSERINALAEYSTSFYTPAVNHSGLTRQENAGSQFGVVGPNASNSSFSVKFIGDFPQTKFELEGDKIGGSYFTLGNPFLRNDRLMFKSTFRQTLWKKRLHFTASATRISDNQSNTKAYSTVTETANLSLRFQYKKLPQVIVSFAPGQTKGTWEEMHVTNYSKNTQKSITVVHFFLWKGARINLGASHYRIKISNQFASQRINTEILTSTITANINYKKIDVSSVLLVQQNKGLLQRKLINCENTISYSHKGYVFGGVIGAGKDDYLGSRVLIGLKAGGRLFKNNQVQLNINKTYFISTYTKLINPILINISFTQKI